MRRQDAFTDQTCAVLSLLTKGRHWVLVVCLMHDMPRPYISSRYRSSYQETWYVCSFRGCPCAIQMVYHFFLQIVNESLPIFLDSAVSPPPDVFPCLLILTTTTSRSSARRRHRSYCYLYYNDWQVLFSTTSHTLTHLENPHGRSVIFGYVGFSYGGA